jgi:hypothetical protein
MPNTAERWPALPKVAQAIAEDTLPQQRPIALAIFSPGALRTVLRDIRDHDLEEIEEPTKPVFDPVSA